MIVSAKGIKMLRKSLTLALMLMAGAVMANDWITEGLKGKVKRTILTRTSQKIEDTWYDLSGNRVEMSLWEFGKPTAVAGRTLYVQDSVGRRVLQYSYAVREKRLTLEERALVTIVPLECYVREYRWFRRLASGEIISETVYDELGRLLETLDYTTILFSISPQQKVVSIVGRDAAGTVVSIRTQVYTSTLISDIRITTLEAPLVAMAVAYVYSTLDAQGNWTVRTAPDGAVTTRTLEYYP